MALRTEDLWDIINSLRSLGPKAAARERRLLGL
jgi:hypothetical protein